MKSGVSDMPSIAETGVIIGTPKPTPANPSISDTPMEDPTQPIVIDGEEALRQIEHLRSDDLSLRVSAARKLTTISAALGPDRTREELLPFLSDGVDDEDEVLEAIATSLGELISLVGSTPEKNYGASLLGPLELLLAVEENSVREKAAESAIKVGNSLNDSEYRVEFVGMIDRLVTKEWFTARIAGCGLIPIAFKRMGKDLQVSHIVHIASALRVHIFNETISYLCIFSFHSQQMKSTHLQYFSNLCRDDAPMVRRIASRSLGPLIYAVAETIGTSSIAENGSISTTLLELLELLAAGDQPDSVRLHAIENCVFFGNALTLLKTKAASNNSIDEENIMTRSNALVKRVLPLIVGTIDDRSWRVRWTAASKFALVVKAFSPLSNTMDILVPAFEKLLQDPEAEVRTSAALNLADVAKTGCSVHRSGWQAEDGMDCTDNSQDNRISIAERLVDRVMALTDDDSENVRAALAMVATELAPLLGKAITITHLLSPMLVLLRDATPEVRLNIISSLSMLSDVIGEELLSESLLPAILDLAEDGKWRIRMAVIERMPMVAKQFGKDFFNHKLLELCVGWLGDDISSIREAAARNLKELTTVLGTDWSVQHLLPRVKAVTKHPSYLRRMNAVQGIVYMMTAMDVDTTQSEVLPILLEMAFDTVPNVRFNVAKGLGVVGPHYISSVYESQISRILTLLVEDSDRDVRYFASQTSASLKDSFKRD